jgi:hypothetical protein
MPFSETFENVAMVGVESLTITADVRASGGYATGLDIDPCTQGS